MPSHRPQRAGCRRAWALILSGLLLAGCQSGPASNDARCQLKPGLTTEALARCGCFSTSTQSRYRITEEPEDDAARAESVSILTFMCPRGTAGFARVMVINGIASQVER